MCLISQRSKVITQSRTSSTQKITVTRRGAGFAHAPPLMSKEIAKMGFGVFLGHIIPGLELARWAFDTVPGLAPGLCHLADMAPGFEWLVELLLS